jgi:SAM-dependent methyltransferase
VAHASERAAEAGAAARVRFLTADATAPLAFEDGAFDALLCVDSMNHFPDRPAVLAEWHRVLRPGGHALFTDPVVITGPVTNDELAQRSSIGAFLFVPHDVMVRFVGAAGFTIVREEDLTANAARVAGRWRDARQARRAELTSIEGSERFEDLQRFFAAVHVLSRERRLSRIAWVVEKPAP